MTIEQIFGDTRLLAIGASLPTPEEAEEFLKLTDEDIAGIQRRHEKLLDEMLENPRPYELLNR